MDLQSRILPQRSMKNKSKPLKLLSSRVSSKSRLGNHLFELSALLGIAKTLNRIPVFYITNEKDEKMLRNTNETSPGLIQQITVVHGPVPSNARITSFHPNCCDFEDPRVLLSIDDEHLHINGFYYQSYKYFPNMRKNLLGYLKNTSTFGNLPKSYDNNFITCVHTRRGDFIKYGLAASDPDFVKKAMKFIVKKEALNPNSNSKSKRYTVLFGDDEKFMKGLFENGTVVISRNSPSEDLVYSKYNCDTVFISAPQSTFGWWIGYFSKGNKVYHMDIRITNDKSYINGEMHEPDYYPPHWTALRYSEDRKTVIESSRRM